MPVLLAGDLNAKHVDWNSRLSTTRGKLLRDYADSNSSVNFRPHSPTTNPYIPSATPDALDIAITRDFQSPIDLTSCSALSSDYSLYSSTLDVVHHFIAHRIDLMSGALTGPISRPNWKPKSRSIWNCSTVWISKLVLGTSPATSSRLWWLPHPNVAIMVTQNPDPGWCSG